MKIPSIMKLDYQSELDQIRDLVYSKLDTVWQELEFFKRVVRNVPLPEIDRMVLWWLYSFCAETAHTAGVTKEEYLDYMSKAFDEVEASEEEDEYEDNVEDLVSKLAVVPSEISVATDHKD